MVGMPESFDEYQGMALEELMKEDIKGMKIMENRLLKRGSVMVGRKIILDDDKIEYMEPMKMIKKPNQYWNHYTTGDCKQ
jgi:hypothetical protein